jgi:hypothetical protein
MDIILISVGLAQVTSTHNSLLKWAFSFFLYGFYFFSIFFSLQRHMHSLKALAYVIFALLREERTHYFQKINAVSIDTINNWVFSHS